VPYGSSDVRADATGIIFPSGIFERVEYHNTAFGERYADVSCDRVTLLAVHRQVTNLLRAGGWVVVLAGEIIDEFPAGNMYRTFRSDDTDLAKRLLAGVRRTRYPEGTGAVSSKRDEFTPYIRQWGVARTFFEPTAARVLAEAGD